MADLIQLRRDTSANWTSANPILAQGEIGIEIDSLRLKIGNGIDHWNILSYYTTNNDTFAISASRNSNNTTNVFLRTGDGSPTNISPFVLPYAGKLVAIGASTNGIFTWSAQIYRNGILLPSGSLSISASNSAFNNTFNISVNAGDKISLYCNGTNINNPNILAIFQK